MSQQAELTILEAIVSSRDTLPRPQEFVAQFADEVPFTVILNFLHNHGFLH